MANNAYVSFNVTTIPSGYSDGFSSFNSSYWSWITPTAGVTQSVTDSQIEIDLPSGTEAYQWGGVTANNPIRLTSNTVGYEFAQTGQASVSDSDCDTGLTLNTTFSVSDDPTTGSSIWLHCSEGQLQCGYDNTYDDSVTAADPTFDPTNHKYVRIRESDGTIYWEASPDDSTWTTVGTLATSGVTFNVNAVYPVLYGFTWAEPSPSDNTVGLTNFNTTYPSTAPVVTTSDVVILDYSNSIVAYSGDGLPGTISYTFAYGDSEETIKAGLTSAIQNAAGDSTLNVIYL
jgi:hypothetical protein